LQERVNQHGAEQNTMHDVQRPLVLMRQLSNDDADHHGDEQEDVHMQGPVQVLKLVIDDDDDRHHDERERAEAKHPPIDGGLQQSGIRNRFFHKLPGLSASRDAIYGAIINPCVGATDMHNGRAG
jgi:hypothetical protein